jgi:competence protein ComEA
MERSLRFAIYALVIGAFLSAGVVLAGRRVAGREAPQVLETEPATELAVYVSGAARNPGVYTLSEGARVADALLAAGGPADDADLDRLNQAQRLRDEMQIHVPRRGEAVPTVSAAGVSFAATPAGAVNLNRASAAELEKLPGIGPVTSARILDHRAKNGPFRSVEQLRDLKLVNASTFERIKGQVTVD